MRDVRVAKPLLHLRSVGFVFERVGGGRCAQTVHAETVDADLRLLCVGEYALVDAIGRD